jgi:hypothetical protein
MCIVSASDYIVTNNSLSVLCLPQIMRMWSNAVRDRRRGVMLIDLWNNTAGRRFVFQSFSRWRLVHWDLYFLITTIKKVWRGFYIRKRLWYGRYRYLQRFRHMIGKVLLLLMKKRKQLVFRVLKDYFVQIYSQQCDNLTDMVLRRAWIGLKRNRRKYKSIYTLVDKGRRAVNAVKKRYQLLHFRGIVQRKNEIKFYITLGYQRFFSVFRSYCRNSMKRKHRKTLSIWQGRCGFLRWALRRLKLRVKVREASRHATHLHQQRRCAWGLLMLLKSASARLSERHKVRGNRISFARRRRMHVLYVWFQRFVRKFKARWSTRVRVQSYFLRGTLRRIFIRMLQRARKRLHGNDSIAHCAQWRGRVLSYLYGFKRGRGLGAGVPTQARASPRWMLRGRVRRYFMRFRRFLSNLRRQRHVVVSEEHRQNRLRLELGFAKLMRAWTRSKGFSFGAPDDRTRTRGRLQRGGDGVTSTPHHYHVAGAVGASNGDSRSMSRRLFVHGDAGSASAVRPLTHVRSVGGAGSEYYDEHVAGLRVKFTAGNGRGGRLNGPGLVLHLGVASSMIARSRTSWPHLNRHRDESTTAVSRALHRWLRRTRLLFRCSRAVRRIDEYRGRQIMQWALHRWVLHRWRRRRRIIRVERGMRMQEYKPHRKLFNALSQNCKHRRILRRKLSLYFLQILKNGMHRFFQRLKLFRRVYRYRRRLVYIRKMKVLALLFITRLRRATRQLSIIARQERRDRIAYHMIVRAFVRLRRNVDDKRQFKFRDIQMRWKFRNSAMHRLLLRWHFWLRSHRKMQRIARRFRLKPSLTHWASLAIGEMRERRIVGHVTKLRNKHTKRRIVAAWRIFAVSHAMMTHSRCAVEAIVNRRRRKYAIRAWLKSLDDSICRTKFQFVHAAHNGRMVRKYFYLWHKTSLLSELGTYKSASIALRNWRKITRGFGVQRVYWIYAEKEYLLRAARLYMHRWLRHCRRAGYFQRRRHSIARTTLAKTYLKYFRRWKRRMFVIARGKFIIRKGKNYSIFKKQPTERIFNAYRCLRVWYRYD